jgi:hypothetical protein
MLRKRAKTGEIKMARKERKSRRDFVTGHEPSVGRNDFAGLPRDEVMEEYPRNRMMPGSRLDDTMSEIDAIQTDSEGQLESHLSHQK